MSADVIAIAAEAIEPDGCPFSVELHCFRLFLEELGSIAGTSSDIPDDEAEILVNEAVRKMLLALILGNVAKGGREKHLIDMVFEGGES